MEFRPIVISDRELVRRCRAEDPHEASDYAFTYHYPFTDSGGGDWYRAQTLGAVIRTAVGRSNATTCGYNRAEFILECLNLV